MKKTLNYIKILMVAYILCALSSCSEYTECPRDIGDYTYYFEFNNKSGHTVSCIDESTTWVLQSGEMKEMAFSVSNFAQIFFHFKEGDYFSGNIVFLFKGTTKVVFDNVYEITHTDDMPNSLFKIQSYDDISTYKYVYTFTDADYDYAVEHGVKLDEKIE